MFLVKLTGFFFLIRSIQYILIFLAPAQFDTSTELLLKQLINNEKYNYLIYKYINVKLFNKLLSWDSAFYLKLILLHSEDNEHLINFEHERAFSFVWTKLIFIISNYYNSRAFKTDPVDVYFIVKVGLIVENILFYLSTLLLYYLTILTFSKNNFNKKKAVRIAEKTAILFIFSSVSGFITSIYSEPLSFALTFLGLVARELSIEYTSIDSKSNEANDVFDMKFKCWPLYTIVTTVSFIFATWNRSNCILLGIYFVHDLIMLMHSRKFLKLFLFPLLSGVMLFLSFILFQYYLPYTHYCPERGLWCDTTIINVLPFITKKSFYNYVQLKYWNVGLFNYWTLNNLPNFLFALPNLVILTMSTVYFTKKYPTYNILPMVWITRCLLFILLFIAHVQIINRVSSFIPIHLWYISDKLYKNQNLNFYKKTDSSWIDSAPTSIDRKKNNMITNDFDDHIIRLYMYWIIFWVPLQTIFFACFLPPA